jgi:glutamate synthase (NADPH/NADH) small chain
MGQMGQKEKMMNENIKEKSEYCLNCKVKPCSNKGCPLNNNIPDFIKCIKEQNIEEAYNILCETTVLQAICGRICPHEKQCQGSCVRGIKSNPVSIGDLETFVGDYAIENNLKIKANKKEELTEKRVAVIGRRAIRIDSKRFFSKKWNTSNYIRKIRLFGRIIGTWNT